MNLREFTWIYVNLHEFTWIYMNLREFTWIYVNYLILCQFTWIYVNLCEFMWIYVNLHEFIKIYKNLCKFTQIYTKWHVKHVHPRYTPDTPPIHPRYGPDTAPIRPRYGYEVSRCDRFPKTHSSTLPDSVRSRQTVPLLNTSTNIDTGQPTPPAIHPALGLGRLPLRSAFPALASSQ